MPYSPASLCMQTAENHGTIAAFECTRQGESGQATTAAFSITWRCAYAGARSRRVHEFRPWSGVVPMPSIVIYILRDLQTLR
jgi:hypothetical protein